MKMPWNAYRLLGTLLFAVAAATHAQDGNPRIGALESEVKSLSNAVVRLQKTVTTQGQHIAYIESFLSNLFTATVTLTNDATVVSSDPLRIVAYLNNAGHPIVVGTRPGNWYADQTWTVWLGALTRGDFYTFELQDTAQANAVYPPRSDLIQIPTAGGPMPGGFIYNGTPRSGSTWFVHWGWQTEVSSATLTITNQSTLTSTDPLAIVAYLDNTGNPIFLGTITNGWDPQQTWTMSLSPLTAGNSYTFELQDTAYSGAFFPPRSNPLQIPFSGPIPSGYVYNNGSGGWFGWHIQWGW